MELHLLIKTDNNNNNNDSNSNDNNNNNNKSKDLRPVGGLDRGTLVFIMRILLLVEEESRLAKRIRLLCSAIY